MAEFVKVFDTSTGDSKVKLIQSAHVASGQIGTDHLGAGVVTYNNMANGSVRSAELASGQVGTNHLAQDIVGTGNLNDGAVMSAKLASGQIGTSHIAPLAVDTGNLAADAVDGTKIADNSIGNEHLTDGSVKSAEIASGQIGSNHLAQDIAIDVSKRVIDDETFTAGEDLTAGDPVGPGTMGNPNSLLKTDTESPGVGIPCLGLVTETVSSGDAMGVAMEGVKSFASLTSGDNNAKAFVASGGRVFTSPGSSSGDYVQKLGTFVNASTLLIDPEQDGFFIT